MSSIQFNSMRKRAIFSISLPSNVAGVQRGIFFVVFFKQSIISFIILLSLFFPLVLEISGLAE